MPKTALPVIPLGLFGVVEPLLLLWAYMNHLYHPHLFYADQVPNSGALATVAFPPQAQILVYQLGNVYLLLALLAVVCCWTPNRVVARGYLAAVALADLGHIFAVYRVLSADTFWDVSQWNAMLFGSVGVSAFLHIHRLISLLGLYD